MAVGIRDPLGRGEDKPSNIPGGICWFSSGPCRAGGSPIRSWSRPDFLEGGREEWRLAFALSSMSVSLLNNRVTEEITEAVRPLDSLIPLEEEEKPSNIPGGIADFVAARGILCGPYSRSPCTLSQGGDRVVRPRMLYTSVERVWTRRPLL